jgi:hypothetical protein
MEERVRYRGKNYTFREINEIREIPTVYRDRSRRFISQEKYRQCRWRQANGVLKDMICRGLLLQLEARGFIKFLPRQKNPLNPPSGRQELDRLSYLGVRVYWRCSHLDCFGQSEGQGDQDRPLRSLC